MADIEFKGYSLEITDEPVGFELHFKGFALSFEDDPTQPLHFQGLSLEITHLFIASLSLSDLVGNMLTFQISSAVLTDVFGINNFPLTFPLDSLVANEIDFGLEGVMLSDLRLSFTIDAEFKAGKNVNETFQLMPI